MTKLVGPPRDRGISDSIRASVTAVGTSPSFSICGVSSTLQFLSLHVEHTFQHAPTTRTSSFRNKSLEQDDLLPMPSTLYGISTCPVSTATALKSREVVCLRVTQLVYWAYLQTSSTAPANQANPIPGVSLPKLCTASCTAT